MSETYANRGDYMILYWRVAAALAIAIFLIGSHWKAYRMGGNEVRAEWTSERLVQEKMALAASEANRQKEQVLNDKVRKVSHDYSREKAAHAAIAARLADSLRDLNAVIGSEATSNSTAIVGLDDLTRTRYVVGQCARQLAEVAEVADTTAIRLIGLQDYVKAVGLAH